MSEPVAASRWRPGWMETGFLLAGLSVLGLTLWRIGITGLLRDLATIGWGFLLILLVEGVAFVLNTSGWALAFPSGERRVSFGRLFALRLAGDGVNYLTPSATVGGELVRIRLLGPGVPAALAWASVGAAKVGQSVAQAMFIFLGLALVLPAVTAFPPWAALLAGVAAGTVATAAFVGLTRRGFWRTLGGLVRGVGLSGLLPTKWGESGREVDATLARLGTGRASGSLLCFLTAWAVGAVEVALILNFVGAPAGWRAALAVETGSVLIDGILFFVPAKVGTQEGGKVLLFAALGLDPARGLTVGIVRRIRELVYAGLGLLVLAWLTARAATSGSRAPAEVDLGVRSRHHV